MNPGGHPIRILNLKIPLNLVKTVTTDPEGKDPSENPGTEDKNPSTDDGTVTEPENPSDKNPSDKDPTGTDEDTEPKEIPDPEPTVDDVPKDSA